MVTVIGTIGEIPPDHRGYDNAVDEIRGNYDSYDQGVESLTAKVPEGWRLLFWRTESV